MKSKGAGVRPRPGVPIGEDHRARAPLDGARLCAAASTAHGIAALAAIGENASGAAKCILNHDRIPRGGPERRKLN
jgi:hypothetical protein